MKKLLTLALATAALTASAADFNVYKDGQLNSNTPFFGWWNINYAADAANPDGSDSKVMSFKANDGGAAFSCGFLLDTNSNDVYTGPLHSATLNFDYYAVGTGTYTIRLTSVTEQNYTFSVTEENAGKWNTISLPVAETYPVVAQEWADFKNVGKGYVFSVVAENASADAVFYANNVYYSSIDTEWKAPEKEVYPAPTTVPVPETPAADVISVFGNHYPQATTFWIGGWGQATQVKDMEIDGNNVEYLTNFNYLGWEFASHLNLSDYQYMHVDYYTPNGVTFGFTPIGNGENVYKVGKVKQNEWNSYDVKLTEFPNVNFADVYQIKFDLGSYEGNFSEGYIANVYFYKGSDDPNPPVVIPDDGVTYKDSVEGNVSQTMNDETKEYPYTLDYTLVWNKDQTLTVKAVFNWKNGEPVGVVDGSVFINNELNNFSLADGVRTVTTSTTYNANDILTLNFYLPMALGVVEKQITYEVGTEKNGTNGIAGVEADENAPVEYYSLQGVRVNNPENGIYIRIQGNKVAKVVIR